MNSATHIRPVYETRWRNFRALLASREMTITAAAELLEKTQGQVSHFGGSRPSKVIGDQLAGEIEAAFGLGPGDLDWPDLNKSGSEAAVKSAPGSRAEMRTTSQNQTLTPSILTQVEHWLRFEEDALKRKGIKAWGADPVSQAVRRAERQLELIQLLQARGGTLRPEESADIIDAVRQRGEDNGRKTGRGET